MSVTIEGIKGYEYQYKVSVLAAMLMLNHGEKAELFIEKIGNEDALLLLEENNIKRRIQIQIKREKSSIDINKIAEWLAHFSERKSNENLFQRLWDNQDQIALFITHSRCSDDTVILKTDIKNMMPHDDGFKVSKSFTDEFKFALTSLKFGKTALMSKRKAFCKKQAIDIKSKVDLINILKNVLVWEEFTDEKVDSAILELMIRDGHIPQSKADYVYLKLLEKVREGRDDGENILDSIRVVIQSNQIGRPSVDEGYMARNEEVEAIQELNVKGILLLTGSTLCGKSELAKKISTIFFDQGYDYLITDNIEELRRFFTTNKTDDKVAILEDPWGHLNLLPGHEGIKRRIEQLLANLEKHHKLIVTTSIETLFEVFKTDRLDQCLIGSFSWKDLTIRDNNTINNHWLEFSKQKVVSRNVTNRVSALILGSPPDHLLQIGQVKLLVGEETTKLETKNDSELEHLARRSSRDVAESIKQKNEFYAEIMAVISMCATAIHGVNLIDLEFILSDSNEGMSIIDKTVFTSSFSTEEQKFPVYNRSPLSVDAKNAIVYLEERQLVKTENDFIRFTHPNYFEAGRFLLISKSSIKQKRILEALEKCIACLSPRSAYLAAQQLLFVYERVDKDLKNDTIEIGFKCVRSIFPSVEDNGLIYLISVINDLTQEQKEKLVRILQSGGTTGSNIFWLDKEIPYISTESSFGSLFMKVDAEAVVSAKSQLKQQRLPNLFDSWMFLADLRLNDTDIGSLKILLKHNEAFVRSKVVNEIFKKLNYVSEEFIREIFSDEHPSVIFTAIRAAFLNWRTLNDKLKPIVKNLILESLTKTQVSIRAFNLITTFSIDYGSEGIFNISEFDKNQKSEIWNFWGELFSITQKNAPLNIFINTARFSATMDEAVKYLELNVGMDVLNAWFERIDTKIRNDLVLDEFEMSVAANLMDLTNNNHAIRYELIQKLLGYDDTNFLLSNLRWIVSYWDRLHSSEKSMVLSLINSGRTDDRWIKAVLVTRESPPMEILEAIFQDGEILNQAPERILTIFPEQLLSDCLNVYCGFPQPLWWLALHHRNTNFWGKIIRHILTNKNNVGFDTCLQEFLNYGVNGFPEDWNDWEGIWKQMCSSIEQKSILVESLIYNTAECSVSIHYAKKLWGIIISSFAAEGKEEEIVNQIVNNIELLQQTGHKEDLIEILGKTFLEKKVIPKLVPDNLVITTLSAFDKEIPFTSELEQSLISLIEGILSKKSIRFFVTFHYIERLITAGKIPDALKPRLQHLPNAIDSIGKGLLTQQRARFEYKLDNWIGIN